jgi:hypothetical protein
MGASPLTVKFKVRFATGITPDHMTFPFWAALKSAGLPQSGCAVMPAKNVDREDGFSFLTVIVLVASITLWLICFSSTEKSLKPLLAINMLSLSGASGLMR